MSPMSERYDCLIVGGGPAGLTAAIYLARYRRKIVVFDRGNSRARLIPESHNYPGFPEGVSGAALVQALRKQAQAYSVEIITSSITELKGKGRTFTARFSEGEVKSPFVLLATGMVDASPDLAGIEEAIASGLVRYCPVCDGYEATGQRIGVLGHSDDASAKARFLRTYSNDVTLLNLNEDVSHDDRAKLCSAGIKISGPLQAIQKSGSHIRVLLQNGETLEFDMIYPVLGCEVRSELAVAVGAKTNDIGCLVVDAYQRTTVEGLYAAGDVVSDLHQIAVATGHAAIAATHIHKSLPDNYFGPADALGDVAA